MLESRYQFIHLAAMSLQTVGALVRHVFSVYQGKEAKSRSSWSESVDPVGQCQLRLLYLSGGVQSLFVDPLIKLACHIIVLLGVAVRVPCGGSADPAGCHPSCRSHIITQEAEPRTHVVDQLI